MNIADFLLLYNTVYPNVLVEKDIRLQLYREFQEMHSLLLAETDDIPE